MSLCLLPATHIVERRRRVLRHLCLGVPIERLIEELASFGHIAQHNRTGASSRFPSSSPRGSVLRKDSVKGRGVTGETLGKFHPPVDVLPLSVGVPLLRDGE